MKYEEFEEYETRKKSGRGWLRLRMFFLIIIVAVAGFCAGQFILWGRTSGTGGLNNVKIIQKLFLLEAYVDKFYLNDFDAEEQEADIYRGYMAGLDDPYAAYYTKEEYEQMLEEDSGQYIGIGVTIRKDAASGYAVIDQVNKDGPAYDAGVEAEDIIVAIDGQDTSGLTLQEAVSLIKKDKDKPVTLSVLRGNTAMELIVKKTKIEMETVVYEMKKNNIGYISVSQFIENTANHFDSAISSLEEQGMKGLIIDLRDNGGGLLTACLDMVSRIIPKDKLIVYTEDKNGNKIEYNSDSVDEVNIPIVVLVNENSASASEIMTGCLQDYGAAEIVGEKTYGKGIVQNIMRLKDGSAIKMTVSKYFTPKGSDIHGVGIEPDVVVEMDDKVWQKARNNEKKDTQMQKAYEILNQ